MTEKLLTLNSAKTEFLIVVKQQLTKLQNFSFESTRSSGNLNQLHIR